MTMNEVWSEKFENSIKCYNAIQVLKTHGILDEEEATVCEHNLLADIVVLFEGELENKNKAGGTF